MRRPLRAHGHRDPFHTPVMGITICNVYSTLMVLTIGTAHAMCLALIDDTIRVVCNDLTVRLINAMRPVHVASTVA